MDVLLCSTMFSGCRVRPMDDAVLEPANEPCSAMPSDAENDKRGKHAGDVGHRLRLRDDDAHALLRTEEFRDDGSEQGVDDRHVQPREDVRRGIAAA